MSGQRVAVIGAGNVGCALAADLSLRGIEVRLYGRSPERLDAIRDAGGINVTGKIEGFTRVAQLTTELGEALAGADVVAVTVPAPALPAYAPVLTDLSTPDQLLWLNPGHSGGALYLGGQFRGRAASDRRAICQLSTASHGSRMSGPATVGVFALPRATMAAFPARRADECHARLEDLLPGRFSMAESVLELDLQNINPVLHPAQMVTNASWIEATGGDFFIYREGTGPATARVIAALDDERMVLADTLGVPTLSLVDECARAGFTSPEAAATGDVYQGVQGGEPLATIKSPPTLDHRYLHEDVGWGLVQWIHLAAAVDVPTPAMQAVTALASIVNGMNYLVDGLTLERMGLGNVRADDIAAYAREGPR